MSPISKACLHVRCVADWRPTNARIPPSRIVCCIECGEQVVGHFIAKRTIHARFKNGVEVTLRRPNFKGLPRRAYEMLRRN